MFQRTFTSVLLLLLLGSCVRVIDFTVPFDKKLVVHCFLRPAQAIVQNDSILVAVSTNTPIVGGQTKEQINDATVTLASSNQRINLRLLAPNAADELNQTRRYGVAHREFAVKAAENYTLTVTTPNGLRTESSCTIPPNRVLENDIKITIVEKSKDKIRCRIDWKDLPEANTRYMCSVGIGLSKGVQSTFSSIYVYNTGSEATNNQMTSNELTFSGFGFDYDPAQSIIYVAVATLDKNYYEWGSKQILQRRQNSSNLFPEPVFLNGNVENGLGVFAGYNATLIAKFF